MAKRLAQRTGRRKRPHRVGADGNTIRINGETAEIIAQQKKLFRERFGCIRGRRIHYFSTQLSPHPNFLAMSALMKYGAAYCMLQAILE